MSAIFAEATALWREMKSEYDAHQEDAFWKAEEATNGYMVNRRGKADGIADRSLFSGPAARAYRYASEELLAHWAEHPRQSLSEFEARFIQGRVIWA